ncbi:hypothetical protein ACU4GH_34060, partial [Bradyrhizobium betae]
MVQYEPSRNEDWFTRRPGQLATGAAVTLSWFGVHTVLSGTAYDAPRAAPLPGQVASLGDGRRGDAAGLLDPPPQTVRHGGAQPGAIARRRQAVKTGHALDRRRDPARSRSATPPGGSGYPSRGEIKSYSTAGGRVVFGVAGSSAELVSATPNSRA